MRLHKENTYMYEPLYKTLREFNISKEKVQDGIPVINYENNSETSKLLEKHSHMFQNMVSFENETRNLNNHELIADALKLAVKRILPIKDASLLLFDENAHNLMPIGKKNTDISERMNHYYKEGILYIVFESGKPMILPEINSYNEAGPKLNYILFPILEKERKRGIFAILSSVEQKDFDDFDRQIIGILLNIALAKMEKVILKTKLNSTYEELQTYQAKLSNDFRLSAIGELTDGILEDIMTPLQVIVSTADLLEGESDENDVEIKKIKSQVGKIHTSINRLVKFANLNQKNIKIQPCNINSMVNEYYNLVKSTIESINLEFVLDFEESIPSILSHPNYIFQLITNVIGMIKNNNNGSGGIIIQTRYKSDDIILQFISTAKLKPYPVVTEEGPVKSSDITTRIVENLMSKHEGDFRIESFEENSSTVVLRFPLKRKIRR